MKFTLSPKNNQKGLRKQLINFTITGEGEVISFIYRTENKRNVY